MAMLCAAIINIPLSAHCMPCSCHMSSVQSRSLTMSSHTHRECYVCGPLSACISCAFSVYLCSRPLVWFGENEESCHRWVRCGCLFVCWLSVSRCTLHTHAAVVVVNRYYTVCHYMQWGGRSQGNGTAYSLFPYHLCFFTTLLLL